MATIAAPSPSAKTRISAGSSILGIYPMPFDTSRGAARVRSDCTEGARKIAETGEIQGLLTWPRHFEQAGWSIVKDGR